VAPAGDVRAPTPAAPIWVPNETPGIVIAETDLPDADRQFLDAL
jgi:hypothetical protein